MCTGGIFLSACIILKKMLNKSNFQFINKVKDWREAITKAGNILEENNVHPLLSKMLAKLEVYDTDEEFSTKLKEIKQNILNKENKISIFSQFSDFISLIYQTRKNKFSKLKILEIIAKHKKYITEFRNNKSK